MSDLFQNRYRIPSARAPWHDYNNGWYFVTICTANRNHYFGEIIPDHNGINVMHLSEMGRYADAQIRNIQSHYPYCAIPIWVVMPNHIHLMVKIDGLKTPDRNGLGPVFPVETMCTSSLPPTAQNPTAQNNRWKNPNEIDSGMKSISDRRGWLSVAVGGMKRAVSRFSNANQMPFGWQTRFHEHIVRNPMEWCRIAHYIENNVARWKTDCFRT